MDPMAQSDLEDGLEELEVQFIAETFHKSHPIRDRPIQLFIDRVWIKDKRKRYKDVNGVRIKLEPQPRTPLNQRFAELQSLRQQSGIVFETDPIESEDDDDMYDDMEDNDDGLGAELGFKGKHLKRSTKNKISINLAKKLKKRAIANRLGIAYQPNNNRLKDLRNSLGTTKSWSEKFGRLLAAKKLLYLPLLFRKYKMGPKRSREELDIEIDLYMAEVRKAKKLRLGFSQIQDAVNGDDNGLNNGLTVVSAGGFGGPAWRKRSAKKEKEKEEVVPNRDELDMEIDEYMANKSQHNRISLEPETIYEQRLTLDSELDEYMSLKQTTSLRRQEITVNGIH